MCAQGVCCGGKHGSQCCLIACWPAHRLLPPICSSITPSRRTGSHISFSKAPFLSSGVWGMSVGGTGWWRAYGVGVKGSSAATAPPRLAWPQALPARAARAPVQPGLVPAVHGGVRRRGALAAAQLVPRGARGCAAMQLTTARRLCTPAVLLHVRRRQRLPGSTPLQASTPPNLLAHLQARER